jgi:hypothetical protein
VLDLCELEEAVEEQQLERGVRSEQGDGARVARAGRRGERRSTSVTTETAAGGKETDVAVIGMVGCDGPLELVCYRLWWGCLRWILSRR